jgi:hypothetical protein
MYFMDQQVQRLERMSRAENLSEAEIVRRALDAYLAWNDPAYLPTPPTRQTRKAHSSTL